MPRWALGTIVVAPLGVLLGNGRIASVVELVRETFIVMVFLMLTWLVLGSSRNRAAM